ncbi:MAG: SCP2 sterol-binding domain-containing protein [Rhizobiaceae bacterium]|nr:SCP2 sterol-binding domain-containing protein [Rhizobiaceae bacterium]
MDLETVAGKIREKLGGSGFDRSVRIDLGEAGSILLDGTTVSVGPGEADCTISIAADDFEDLLAGELSPTSAFMTGRMTVEGDMSAAMALSQMI